MSYGIRIRGSSKCDICDPIEPCTQPARRVQRNSLHPLLVDSKTQLQNIFRWMFTWWFIFVSSIIFFLIVFDKVLSERTCSIKVNYCNNPFEKSGSIRIDSAWKNQTGKTLFTNIQTLANQAAVKFHRILRRKLQNDWQASYCSALYCFRSFQVDVKREKNDGFSEILVRVAVLCAQRSKISTNFGESTLNGWDVVVMLLIPHACIWNYSP